MKEVKYAYAFEAKSTHISKLADVEDIFMNNDEEALAYLLNDGWEIASSTRLGVSWYFVLVRERED